MQGYGRCRRNHAADRGGFNHDGCQEFMPSERETERCAACGCHSCFHCEKYLTITQANRVSLPIANAAGQSRERTHPPAAAQVTPCPLVPGYGRCRRNHAADRGGFSYDGCQEFMPSERDIERCAACGCHSCFHCEKYLTLSRVSLPIGNAAGQSRERTHPPPAAQVMPCQECPTCHRRRANMTIPPLPIPSMVPWQEQRQVTAEARHGGAPVTRPGGPERRRRRQPKLSERQKEEMRLFAEGLSWRVREQDEEELKRFCAAMGIRRNWFKLWMHKTRATFCTPSSAAGPSNPTNHA